MATRSLEIDVFLLFCVACNSSVSFTVGISPSAITEATALVSAKGTYYWTHQFVKPASACSLVDDSCHSFCFQPSSTHLLCTPLWYFLFATGLFRFSAGTILVVGCFSSAKWSPRAKTTAAKEAWETKSDGGEWAYKAHLRGLRFIQNYSLYIWYRPLLFTLVEGGSAKTSRARSKDEAYSRRRRRRLHSDLWLEKDEMPVPPVPQRNGCLGEYREWGF